MKIICFPHFYYLSEVSRLVEMGLALRRLGQDVTFFSHGGTYEYVAREAGFEIVAVTPTMSPERAVEYLAFNRGEKGNPLRDSFFTYDELQTYVPSEADALRQIHADAVLIGWNLPSYLSAPLAGIPIIVQQPGPFTAPFFDRRMGVFRPSLFGTARHLPLNWLINWWLPRTKIWMAPFNRMAASLGLPQWKSLLDLMAGDLTLVMMHPESWASLRMSCTPIGPSTRHSSTDRLFIAMAAVFCPFAWRYSRVRFGTLRYSAHETVLRNGRFWLAAGAVGDH